MVLLIVVALLAIWLLLSAITSLVVARQAREAGLPRGWLLLGVLPVFGFLLVKRAVIWSESHRPWRNRVSANHRPVEVDAGVDDSEWALMVQVSAYGQLARLTDRVQSLDTGQRYVLGTIGLQPINGHPIELAAPRPLRPSLGPQTWAELSFGRGGWWIRVDPRSPQPLVLKPPGFDRCNRQPIILSAGQESSVGSGWSIRVGPSELTLFRLPQETAQQDAEVSQSISGLHRRRGAQTPAPPGT